MLFERIYCFENLLSGPQVIKWYTRDNVYNGVDVSACPCLSEYKNPAFIYGDEMSYKCSSTVDLVTQDSIIRRYPQTLYKKFFEKFWNKGLYMYIHIYTKFNSLCCFEYFWTNSMFMFSNGNRFFFCSKCDDCYREKKRD